MLCILCTMYIMKYLTKTVEIYKDHFINILNKNSFISNNNFYKKIFFLNGVIHFLSQK